MTRLPHPPLRSLDSAEALGRVKASLAALAAGAALTRPARFDGSAFIGAAGTLEPKGGTPMLDRSHTASISVTIGRLECLYDAVITTPRDFPSPGSAPTTTGRPFSDGSSTTSTDT